MASLRPARHKSTKVSISLHNRELAWNIGFGRLDEPNKQGCVVAISLSLRAAYQLVIPFMDIEHPTLSPTCLSDCMVSADSQKFLRNTSVLNIIGCELQALGRMLVKGLGRYMSARSVVLASRFDAPLSWNELDFKSSRQAACSSRASSGRG